MKRGAQQEAEIRRWMEIKGEIDALKTKQKELETQGKELEGIIITALKGLEKAEFRLDNILVVLKERKTTSVKYKALYEWLLERTNEKIRRIIESMAKKEPYLTSGVKEYLQIKEAPPLTPEATVHRPNFVSRLGRLLGALENVNTAANFIQDEDWHLRVLGALATEDTKQLRRMIMLDDNKNVKRVAIVRLGELSSELVEPLRETEFAKYAQADELLTEVYKLEALLDVFEDLVKEGTGGELPGE